eukprot:TRINITY_DN2441_c0_g1_i1.p1 TRINITY_DN2441_c0_g1~~TRINITY_DN2441_c0_g1_i1.p1  ORF type:complete len:479 (+),score=23.99 TRINITY_DN2441_c0_g1_i1:56-1492(+)
MGGDLTPTRVRQILHGVCQSSYVYKSSDASSHPLGPDSFDSKTAPKYTVPSLASPTTLTLKNYAPLPFEKLRQKFEISAEMYMAAWDLPDEKLQLKLGAGRSGSLFLKSYDSRFIMKTIPHDECVSTLELMPGLYNHFMKNEDSLIAPIFGVYKFRSPDDKFVVYVIVLANIVRPVGLPAGYSEPVIFDLKGRVPKPGKAFRHRGEKGIVFKDNDLERVFYLTAEKRDRFLRQIKVDLDFLCNNNLMDYSFLIGVVSLAEGMISGPTRRGAAQVATSPFRCDFGGLGSDDRCSEVYYMGIIDNLTRYGKRKIAAHLIKSVRWESQTLSTVHARYYRDRMDSYLPTIFLLGPPPKREHEASIVEIPPPPLLGPPPAPLPVRETAATPFPMNLPPAGSVNSGHPMNWQAASATAALANQATSRRLTRDDDMPTAVLRASQVVSSEYFLLPIGSEDVEVAAARYVYEDDLYAPLPRRDRGA